MKKVKKTASKKTETRKASNFWQKIYSPVKQLRTKVKSLRWWVRWPIYIFTTIVLLWAMNHLVDRMFPQVKNPQYGVSFSKKYSEELGLDWKENFTALLDDMGIRYYRLMSYWDTIEAKRGTFDFEDLDWQMNEADKRGAKVSLAIGLRQPRWPECHKPGWYQPLSEEDKDQANYTFITEVVNRYKEHPALISYQLENEAMNYWFGTCTAQDRDRERFEEEFKLVKSLDQNHPVYMSLSDQHGLPLGGPKPDKYGYSVYQTIWSDKTGPYKGYLTYPTSVWYHRLRALVLKVGWQRDIFIHELQLEPWGPRATRDLSIEEQNKSMSAKKIVSNLTFARRIGTPEIYTWGGEWWYWRKTTLNDPSIWETVKSELNK